MYKQAWCEISTLACTGLYHWDAMTAQSLWRSYQKLGEHINTQTMIKIDGTPFCFSGLEVVLYGLFFGTLLLKQYGMTRTESQTSLTVIITIMMCAMPWLCEI